MGRHSAIGLAAKTSKMEFKTCSLDLPPSILTPAFTQIFWSECSQARPSLPHSAPVSSRITAGGQGARRAVGESLGLAPRGPLGGRLVPPVPRFPTGGLSPTSWAEHLITQGC